MFRLHVVLLALLLGALVPSAARAQEVQVPLDESGRIEVVDAALAARLGLFADRAGFREARLFQGPDGAFVLEVTSVRGGRTVRERTPMTAEQVRELRAQVGSRAAERAPRALLNQEGRYLLLSQSTLLGVGFYGWALPYVLDVEEAPAFTLFTLTAGASFFLPYVLTEGQPVTYGMANLSRYGATRGLAHGALLSRLVQGDEEECTYIDGDVVYCDDDFGEDRAEVATMLLASVAEGVGGYLWARGERMTAGTANAVATGGDFGLAAGLATAFLAGTDDIGERATAAITLPVAAAGVVAGRAVAARRDYTWGDVDLIYTGGALGAFSGAALSEMVGLEEKPTVVLGMAGAAAGLYLGDRLVRGTDFTVSQAALNRLGTLAGGLVGAGVGVLVSEDDPTPAFVGAALGAGLGYFATYRSLVPAAREQRGESVASAGGWKVRIAPEGVLGMVAGDRLRSAASEPAPLLVFSKSF